MYSKTIGKTGLRLETGWRCTSTGSCPPNGDGRDIVGSGHGVVTGSAGVGLLHGGAGTALVGSHTEVADRIEEYAALGVSEFILSGYPHLEEAYWFGEGVLPILRRRGCWQHPAPEAGDPAVSMIPFAPTSGPAQPATVS
jgi:hypothetical protein